MCFFLPVTLFRLYIWVFLYTSWKAYIIIAIYRALPEIYMKSLIYSIHEYYTSIVFGHLLDITDMRKLRDIKIYLHVILLSFNSLLFLFFHSLFLSFIFFFLFTIFLGLSFCSIFFLSCSGVYSSIFNFL